MTGMVSQAGIEAGPAFREGGIPRVEALLHDERIRLREARIPFDDFEGAIVAQAERVDLRRFLAYGAFGGLVSGALEHKPVVRTVPTGVLSLRRLIGQAFEEIGGAATQVLEPELVPARRFPLRIAELEDHAHAARLVEVWGASDEWQALLGMKALSGLMVKIRHEADKRPRYRDMLTESWFARVESKPRQSRPRVIVKGLPTPPKVRPDWLAPKPPVHPIPTTPPQPKPQSQPRVRRVVPQETVAQLDAAGMLAAIDTKRFGEPDGHARDVLEFLCNTNKHLGAARVAALCGWDVRTTAEALRWLEHSSDHVASDGSRFWVQHRR